MKTLKTTKTLEVEEVKYEAFDGKVFENKEDCAKWEKSYECTVTAWWNAFPKVSVDTTMVGIPYSSEDYEAYLIQPKTLDDIINLNRVVEVITGENGIFSPNEVNKSLILNFGYDRDFAEHFDCDKLVDRIKQEHLKAIEKLAALENNNN